MHIAKTVLGVASMQNPLVPLIMNRNIPLTREFALMVMRQTQFSYHGRKPKSAHDNKGLVRKTNLDLLSLLVDLYKRSARIELTSYDNQLPWQAYAGQQHVGGTKRFGSITGLISHRELLSFSLQMKDESVLKSSGSKPELGAYRNYMIADYQGSWHKGWHGFSWDMNTDEKAYLERRNILVDGNVDYEDYLHLNRRQSVTSAPYLLLKLLWQRIEDEISFFEAEIKRLESLGVERPLDLEPVMRFKIAEGDSASVEVPTFTMRLYGLSFSGEYTTVTTDDLGYRLADRTINFLSHKLRPIVQFMMRADEVAFYRFGLKQDFVSSWIKGSAWNHQGRHSAMIALGDTLRLSYQRGLVEKKVAV
jgi:hypothetical protein